MGKVSHAVAFALCGVAGICAPAVDAATQRGGAALEVKVPASTMPWDMVMNERREFGLGDGTHAMVIWGKSIKAGATIHLLARGGVTLSRDRTTVGPEGTLLTRCPGASSSVGKFPYVRAENGGPGEELNFYVLEPDEPPCDLPGATLRRMPGDYLVRAERPANAGALIAAFVDADGRVIGDPFMVGRRADVVVPDGALGLSLGVNDDRFVDNSGYFSVLVTSVQGQVIVGNDETD